MMGYTWTACGWCGCEVQHLNGVEVTHLDHAVGCRDRVEK